MVATLSADDDVINSFVQQARKGADVVPMYTPPPEDLPPYEPGPNPVPTDQKVLDIVTETVSSPEGKTALRKAIDDLGDSAFSIEVCFTNVARGLASALAKTSTPDLKHDIQQFQEEWDRYRRVIAYASRS